MLYFSKYLFIFLLAIVLRLALRFSTYYNEILIRVEISTPVNAWRRVIEGVSLKKLNISSYTGDTFHESPLFLNFYHILINLLSEYQIFLFFIILDVSTAFILGRVCSCQLGKLCMIEKRHIQNQLVVKNKKDDDSQEKNDQIIYSQLLIQTESIQVSSYWTTAIYLLSPYSLLPCVAQTTSIIHNLLIALALLSATNGLRLISLLLLALLCLNSFYPLILLPAVILLIEQQKHLNFSKSDSFNLNSSRFSIFISTILFSIFYSSFLFGSFYIENGSFQFLQSTYMFMWTVSDLTPNIGLFWYFFTEMFDHFRDFFLWVFQINYFIYIIPLTINFWRNPSFLMTISLIIHCLFKPYPSVSDFALYLALLPQWTHLFENMKSTLVIVCTIVTCTVLAPILWYLWIILGTANSNFYFGITLAFNVAQIFLTTDLMFSYVKREFYLKNLQLYKLCKKADKTPKIELSF